MDFIEEETMNKPTIKPVIVVEGRSDTQNLQNYFNVHTIETNGSAVSPDVLAEIKQAQAIHGVVVFTDPDISGTKIRHTVSQAVPGVQHAFLTREEAKPKFKGSLGIEHANEAALKRALESIYQVTTVADDEDVPLITTADLQRLGLVGTTTAKMRREQLAKDFRLGHVNGKQLAKRLQLFGIDLNTIVNYLQEKEQIDA